MEELIKLKCHSLKYHKTYFNNKIDFEEFLNNVIYIAQIFAYSTENIAVVNIVLEKHLPYVDKYKTLVLINELKKQIIVKDYRLYDLRVVDYNIDSEIILVNGKDLKEVYVDVKSIAV